ncbi:MAG TPA: site-specific DNA-methyltransferase [Clostridiales bacterium]|nr:site-specific DNA-methyltransferase [Clostridiales bacterium]
MLEINKIYNIDCLEGMKLLDDSSVDSIVTDPPYELGFMGKKWDSTGIAYNVDVWRECLRVLKPGGHLLAFGGTRTYHRMACAIEDAGFEIRDQIQWLYGSGFPKSHDISKAIDKKLGAEREVISRKKKLQSYGYEGNNVYGGDVDRGGIQEITAPSTNEAKQWDGWGTALKPANEPIVLARKPISEKTIAENVLKWGTGGLNIDGCRIGTEEIKTYGKRKGEGVSLEWSKYTSPEGYEGGIHQGRFPANVILDEEAGKMLDEQSGILKSGGGNKANKKPPARKSQVIPTKDTGEIWEQNSGGASRFFYCAKASKKERGEGNNHPTVKPVSLIKYLVTLVTPPDGVCLDPFMGSGTTAVACIKINRNFIGFELDPAYCAIAEERIKKAKQNKLF